MHFYIEKSQPSGPGLVVSLAFTIAAGSRGDTWLGTPEPDCLQTANSRLARHEMGSGSWVVQEGFLLCKQDEAASEVPTCHRTSHPTGRRPCLEEVYVVLTRNRKLDFFRGSDAATREKIESAYVQGFAGWDGDGLLAADAYGLELKVERHPKARIQLAAFNRVDLEKWCRGFVGTYVCW